MIKKYMDLKLEKMQKAGKAVSNLLEILGNFLKIGTTKKEIDDFCSEYIKSIGGISAALGYKGSGDIPFPNKVCISINNEVCHGTSLNNKKINKGDIVSIDCALSLDGYYGDSCYTFIVGESKNIRHKKLVECAYNAMWNAIESIIPNKTTTGDLGYIMTKTAKSYGFNTVKDFAGHGIGKSLHEEPQIPFYGYQGEGDLIKEGMFITIEPMVNEGIHKILILKDGWTAVTVDGLYSAQFEHTIHITKNGYEVVTFNKFDLEKGKKKFK